MDAVSSRVQAFTFLSAALLACSGAPEPSAESAGPSGESESSTTSSTETETGDGPTETETGEPEPACGDGQLDPGEACDDGNEDESDGCTSACELGPCGFEWLSRNLAFTGSGLEPYLPMVVDGEDLVIAHQLGPGGEQTGLVRADRADGLAYDSAALELGPGGPEAHALAVDGQGWLYLARADPLADELEISRLSAEGEVQWSVARPSIGVAAGLALSPTGELVLAATVDAGETNDDVQLAALDPASGVELWAHAFGGPTAENGYSSDRAAALALDPSSGRTFVAYDQYRAWDTLAPAVVAFEPGGDPEPLWTTLVTELPGRLLEIGDLAFGDAGTLGLVFQRWDGTQKFWVAALDADSGALEWLVERDDFDLPNKLSSVRAVSVLDDRVLASGTWEAELGGLQVYQGYVLGLDRLEGSYTCLGVLDDYEPGELSTGETWLPLALARAGAELYLAGYVNVYSAGNFELLLAKVR